MASSLHSRLSPDDSGAMMRLDDDGAPTVRIGPVEQDNHDIVQFQCNRCRKFFSADSTSDSNARPKWWLCPPCQTALIGNRTQLRPRTDLDEAATQTDLPADTIQPDKGSSTHSHQEQP